MAANKTTENNNSVDDYIRSITDEKRRNDCAELVSLFSTATGLPAKMWGTAIVGFGSYHYRYDSGREGDAPLAGFSSRSNAIVLYLGLDASMREQRLPTLGKYKTGKGCIYIQKLVDTNIDVLKEMIRESVSYTRQLHLEK